MPPDPGLIARLASRHGLARSPLFRSGEAHGNAEQEILLDGALGSFAVSVGRDFDPDEVSSWVWSSNVPHHVAIYDGKVDVVRWDARGKAQRFSLDSVDRDPDAFYEHLRLDRVRDDRTIVAHSMDLFRKVRALVHHAGLEDDASMPAYLALLGALLDDRDPVGTDLGTIRSDYALPDGAEDIVGSLRRTSVEALVEEFRVRRTTGVGLRALPKLAVRHASGAIFQEAHHRLVTGPGPDLFGDIPAMPAARAKRGVVHFTPPALARSLSEQALERFAGLSAVERLVVADVACGSGAFLVEALRALERMAFRGRIVLVGRDTSRSAIDMARFVLHVAVGEWPGHGRCTIDLAVADSLRESLPPADIIVMNPPFAAWQYIPEAERPRVREILGKGYRGRPDLGMAFVQRAVEALKSGGVLAAILPANVFEAASLAGWRGHVAAGSRRATLTALFDDQRLFTHAMVRIGALILSDDVGVDDVRVRAWTGTDGTGDALRALRRRRSGEVYSSDGASFSIALSASDLPASDWTGNSAPRPATTAARGIAEATKLGDLFRVVQGIRTGCNPAFVLRGDAVERLPAKERRWFQPAFDTRDIDEGVATSYAMVFYPYEGDQPAFTSEKALTSAVPYYCEHYLRPNLDKLTSRSGAPGNWWQLTKPRPIFLRRKPLLVSKYFAGPGGCILNDTPVCLVLQGQGWVPTDAFDAEMGDGPERRLAAAAYHALLNSEAFFDLVSENAPRTHGGQRDMSKRYLDGLPFPNLARASGERLNLVRKLADAGRRRYQEGRGDAETIAVVEELCRSILGIATAPEPELVPVPEAKAGMPEWAVPFVDAGMQGTDSDSRIALYMLLTDLAEDGRYKEIDAALGLVDPPSLAETSFLTFLRGTYGFREQLLNWTAYRDRVRDALRDRGAPAERILAGLYE
ncbi:N-6 DNA methylase [Methylorubrum thiocyanatum]|uniref:N-6 DNA methylase n=1 Tax=Methylorubrum thiocyanatum TaxID=47958 RepID=UPI00398C5038